VNTQAIGKFLSDFVQALGAEARRVAFWSRSIKVVRDDGTCLELRAGGRSIVADKLARTVSLGARTVATFETIHRIEVTVHDRHEGEAWWAVGLCLADRKKVRLGETTDDAAASIAAARLATYTGKEVEAVRR
jgi:hypothetical protein